MKTATAGRGSPLAVLVLACVFPGRAQGANYFNWGVESDQVQKIGSNGAPVVYTVEYKGATIRDCTTFHSGSCAMKLITQDAELVRVLGYLGLPTEFPKTKPARSPPLPFGGEESQLDPCHDDWDGKDPPAED